MDRVLGLLADPGAWAALAALLAMEIVLGVDNLIFISVLTNKLPEHQRRRARRIGISGALILRLVLLAGVVWLVQFTSPLFSAFGNEFSWRDLILIAGGLFLVWKATSEIHHNLEPAEDTTLFATRTAALNFGATIAQILLLDMVFSIDSILTAVGMTHHLPIMFISVLGAVAVMLLAADPLAEFIRRNATIVMLALAFLLLIGTTLIAEGFGAHVEKGYVYAAMAFSAFVEGLNMAARKAKKRAAARHS